MRYLFAVIFCLAVPSPAFTSLTSQLYTGDAFTVPPGKVQLQSYYDTNFGGSQRVAGGSLTFGATEQMDAKLGYGYLWNNVGSDVRLGPNVGIKWRVLGDGLRKPSVALSSLYAFNEGVGGKPHKNDYGSLLIFQYPVKPVIFLANLGRVWVGDNNASDLRYISFAAARILSPRSLAAIEYSQLARLGDSAVDQITAAGVYAPNHSLIYTAQLGYLWPAQNAHLHLTLGVSVYL